MQYTIKVIKRAETRGIGTLSSIGLWASVKAPAKAPTKAGIRGIWVKETRKPTTKKAKLPSRVLCDWNGNFILPNLFPIRVDAESPKSSMSIAALAMAMLNWKKYRVMMIPMKKNTNPLSSWSRLASRKIVEKKGTLW
jgi:hypothetical protein